MNPEEKDIELEEEGSTSIDLMEIFAALRSKLAWILAAALFCGAVAYAVSCFLIRPMYAAQAIMVVNNKNSNAYAESINQNQINTIVKLVPTYQAIVSTKSAMKRAIDEGGIAGYTPEELLDMVSTQLVEDTGIFAITVRGPEQYDVADIANAVAQSGTSEIAKYIEGATATVVDRAIVPMRQSSPNNKRNALIGFLIGGVLSSAVVLAIYFMDTRLKKAEDFAKVMDAPVLGVVQSMKGFGETAGEDGANKNGANRNKKSGGKG